MATRPKAGKKLSTYLDETLAGASRLAAMTVSTQGKWLQVVVTDTHIRQTVIGMEAGERAVAHLRVEDVTFLDLAKLIVHAIGGVA